MIQFLKKWLLLVLLVIAFIAFFYFDLYQYLTFATLKKYQSFAQHWTQIHYAQAVGLYLLVFIILIACTIPCATFMALIGGFLFGAWGILYAVMGTTLGGLVLYLAVRSAFGKSYVAKSTGWLKAIEKGFQKNAFNYLLMMRLVPIFPCWISNISAGALNIPIKTFLTATVLGVFPATLIYALLGRGLDAFFQGEKTPNLNIILTPSLFFPLLGLAVISLIPVFYKKFKK